MPKTQLLDLPNELFFFIFQYLSSVEILTAFVGQQSHRIQALIQSFISSLDISKQDNQWVQTYLPEIFSQRRISDLCLRDRQLRFISKYLSIGDVQSIRVLTVGSNKELSPKDFVEDYRSLKKLSIGPLHIAKNRVMFFRKHQLINQFFPMNSNSEYFSSTGEFFYPTNDRVYTYPYLTHLSIELDTIHELFIILHRLPNLETLTVNFPSGCSRAERITDVKNVIPCKNLRSVTFTGPPVYFLELSRFFEAFGSTIESLTLKLSIETRPSDGMDLERGILNKLPRLSSLNLHLYFHLWEMHSDDAYGLGDIKTFQTSTWLKFNPVICWPLSQGYTIMVCTLPYKFKHFNLEPNEFKSWVINQPVPICFEHLHSLMISHTESPWTEEIFEFIKAAFPHVKRLDFACTTSASYDSFDDEGECWEIFSDDLIEKNNIQLWTVTELNSVLNCSHYDNKTLRCLFNLLPNLTVLRVDDLQSFLKMKEEPNYYDDFIIASLNRMKLKEFDSSYGGYYNT